jgi:hypothetical protein
VNHGLGVDVTQRLHDSGGDCKKEVEGKAPAAIKRKAVASEVFQDQGEPTALSFQAERADDARGVQLVENVVLELELAQVADGRILAVGRLDDDRRTVARRRALRTIARSDWEMV